jgi:hypothetical protein
MSGFIEGENRDQSTLFPECIDDYVEEDSAGRLPPPAGPMSRQWFMTSSLPGRAKWPEPSWMTGTAI